MNVLPIDTQNVIKVIDVLYRTALCYTVAFSCIVAYNSPTEGRQREGQRNTKILDNKTVR